jgi:hypothetical protein
MNPKEFSNGKLRTIASLIRALSPADKDELAAWLLGELGDLQPRVGQALAGLVRFGQDLADLSADLAELTANGRALLTQLEDADERAALRGELASPAELAEVAKILDRPEPDERDSPKDDIGNFEQNEDECSHCGASLRWRITPKGAWMPCELDGSPHWSSCAGADQARRRRSYKPKAGIFPRPRDLK